MAQVVVDTGPVSTFARTRSLGLLEARIGGRALMPAEVRLEIERGVIRYPDLAEVLRVTWFEQLAPISDPAVLLELARTRLAVAGPTRDPHKNLGEAAAIVIAQHLKVDILIDDFDGANLARARRLRVTDTLELLREAVAFGEMTCQETLRLYEAMRQVSRLPTVSRRDLCN